MKVFDEIALFRKWRGKLNGSIVEADTPTEVRATDVEALEAAGWKSAGRKATTTSEPKTDKPKRRGRTASEE